MAKRKKANKKKVQINQNTANTVTPAEWPDDDFIALLAWKDYTVRNTDVDFAATVRKHLKNIYTDIEIQKKLRDTWCKCRIHAKQHQREFDQLGTIALQTPHGLNHIQVESVAAAVQKIEETARRKSITSTPRRLRNSSVPDSISVASPVQSQGRKRKSTESSTLSHTKEIDGISQAKSAEQLTPSKKQKTGPKDKSQPIRSVERRPKKSASTRKNSKPQQARVTRSSTVASGNQPPLFSADSFQNLKQESHQGISRSDSKKPATRDTPKLSANVNFSIDSLHGTIDNSEQENDKKIQCRKCHVRQELSDFEYICEGCVTTQNESQQIETLLREVEIGKKHIEKENLQLNSAISEINSLREEIKSYQESSEKQKVEIRELERINWRLKGVSNHADDESGRKVLEALKLSVHENEMLKEELKSRKKGFQFTELRPAIRDRFGETNIVNGFEEAYSQSAQILCRFENGSFPFTPPINQHKNLASLLSQMVEPGIQHQDGMMEKVSILSPQAIVRAVSSLALQRWVFETEFPNFESEENEMLYAYRREIAKQGKPVALRNLDLAAHSYLINKKSFREEVIQRKAKALAIQLSATLAPFFSDTLDSSSELDWEGFLTWREDDESWKERKCRLVEMFAGALLTKADSCLNIEDYQIVTYSPGTRFDHKTMTAESMEGMMDTVKDQNDRKVMLCVQGAFFAYARKPVSETLDVQELLVARNNFISKEDRERVDMRVLKKAIVILEI